VTARALRTALLLLGCAVALPASAQPWLPDLGNGRYRNPVVFADYSDPDVVRVGADFYMTASSFGAVPGLPILHSRDLVNWRLVGHALPRLPADFDVPQHGNGVWAPSIRHHAGAFYIYWGDPDRGIYMVKARDPRGPWDAPVLVKAAKGWIDPAPLWDDDGNAYLVHAFARSRAGIKHRLHVARMHPDGTRLLDEGTLVFMDSVRHPTMEGPKFHKRDGWYYIFTPAGGVATGWQTVLRARAPLGPYEDRIVLAQGASTVNGPHQGAWVELANGTHWFTHFQDRGAYGRIVHLQPMAWRPDGWPVIGADADGDGTGEPVAEWRTPVDGRASARATRTGPQTSDEFEAPRIGPQWQWQANPVPAWHSLTARPGALRLYAVPTPDAATNLWPVPNLLLQKLPAPAFTASTHVAATAIGAGARAGLIVFGQDYAYLAVRRRADGTRELVQARALKAPDGAREQEAPTIALPAVGAVELRVTVREATPGRNGEAGATGGALCRFAYRVNGGAWTEVGAPFEAREGRWVGAKVGVFAVRPPESAAGGYADFANFIVR
jgi:beta-xylosidase